MKAVRMHSYGGLEVLVYIEAGHTHGKIVLQVVN